jgi:CheY-like chemotaxis protein
LGFTELALEDAEAESLMEDNLQEVYDAGKRAKELVRQILAFARQSEQAVKPIQIKDIVKEALQFLRSSIPSTIEIKSHFDCKSYIMGDETQVYQILMNLFTNAAHSMESTGGVLNVRLKDTVVEGNSNKLIDDIEEGHYIEIFVSDTGTGIEPEIIDSIFEPYFTTKAPGEGTGMGLAMVQGLVGSYGGKILVDSQLGKGTTFKIYLPASRSRRSENLKTPEQLPTGTESILFVDDEISIAKMGCQILARLGYSVTARTSSIEALELFRKKPQAFDIIITDMTMPNMTGDMLAHELHKIRPDIPIILCTGYSKKISDRKAAAIGIDAFAYKPIVKKDLSMTIRRVLDEPRK